MIAVLVKFLMSMATLSFAAGYLVRHKNNDRHRLLMLAGFVLTLATAAVLVTGVHLFGAAYAPAFWLVSWLGGEEPAGVVLIVHRLIATAALVLLVTQVYTGIRRLPLHAKLYRFTIAAWLISYFSGMVVFA